MSVIAATGLISVVTGFYFLIPVWNELANSLLGASAPLITDPTYMANVNLIAFYLNILVGLSFIAMGVAIDIWVLLFAWRRETVTYAGDIEYED